MISFEFFPTKTPEGERTLLEKTIPALGELKPDFCSVTYGAGGSTREKTLTIVDRIQREQALTAMAHMTCVNATREETAGVLRQARALGITNILALRGDPPAGSDEFTKTEGGFEFSYELVRFIKEAGAFKSGQTGFRRLIETTFTPKQVSWNTARYNQPARCPQLNNNRLIRREMLPEVLEAVGKRFKCPVGLEFVHASCSLSLLRRPQLPNPSLSG